MCARAQHNPRAAAAQNYAARRSESVCARTAALVEMSLLFQRDFGPNTPGPRP
jgi:hypothetical protein